MRPRKDSGKYFVDHRHNLWGGTIRKKSPNESYDIREDMTSNTYHYYSGDKHVLRRQAKMYQVEIGGVVDQKLDALTKQIASLM
ncbi:hypothetical protein CR513_36002, partial [Mucuna pruriens]